MLKTLQKILDTRPWVKYIDDERGDGGSIIITLDARWDNAYRWDFADDPGCGVKGVDTVNEAINATERYNVVLKTSGGALWPSTK